MRKRHFKESENMIALFMLAGSKSKLKRIERFLEKNGYTGPIHNVSSQHIYPYITVYSQKYFQYTKSSMTSSRKPPKLISFTQLKLFVKDKPNIYMYYIHTLIIFVKKIRRLWTKKNQSPQN